MYGICIVYTVFKKIPSRFVKVHFCVRRAAKSNSSFFVSLRTDANKFFLSFADYTSDGRVRDEQQSSGGRLIQLETDDRLFTPSHHASNSEEEEEQLDEHYMGGWALADLKIAEYK
jgi:hypothetical protein